MQLSNIDLKNPIGNLQLKQAAAKLRKRAKLVQEDCNEKTLVKVNKQLSIYLGDKSLESYKKIAKNTGCTIRELLERKYIKKFQREAILSEKADAIRYYKKYYSITDHDLNVRYKDDKKTWANVTAFIQTVYKELDLSQVDLGVKLNVPQSRIYYALYRKY